MTSGNLAELRRGIETVVRAALLGAGVEADYTQLREEYCDEPGDRHDWGLWATLRRTPAAGVDDEVPEAELPPLPPLKQLALSVLVGEPIPPAVLLGALEDAGVYPNGVLAAAEEAENAPLSFGTPEYHEGETWQDGQDRFRGEASGWYSGQSANVYGVCKGVLGRGNAAIGGLFRRFLDRWLGRRSARDETTGRWLSVWPTNNYLASRMKAFPPLTRVFRHLREEAGPATTEVLDRLIAHLERK